MKVLSSAATTFLCVTIALLGVFPEKGLAEGWTLDIRKREAERKQEKWYFSEHIANKRSSKRLDLLYRFFLGQRAPRARVELDVYAAGEALRQSPDNDTVNVHSGTGVGYGGRIAFNNFVSAVTGLRTPNVVPTAFGSTLDIQASGEHEGSTSVSYGGGLRFFGQNPEDTAVYVDYGRQRYQLLAPPAGVSSVTLDTGTQPTTRDYDAWVPRISAQLYLFPALALTGGGVINESFVPPHVISESFVLSEFQAGLQLDIVLIRLGYDYLERGFQPKNPQVGTTVVKQSVHRVRLGFLF